MMLLTNSYTIERFSISSTDWHIQTPNGISSFLESLDNYLWSINTIEHYISPTTFLYVAKDLQHQLIGLALTKDKEWHHPDFTDDRLHIPNGTHVRELLYISIADSLQGRGIGQHMVHRIFSDSPYDTLVLYSSIIAKTFWNQLNFHYICKNKYLCDNWRYLDKSQLTSIL